ncbi:NAD(P)/FAD-dependent oxidoreductase [Candidatus Woesearchaeota archaeon]|nr:NAD(P)/FAD-dependent oxidoreductase [Candidatus Woesearchaeota archaeon]
MISIVGAGPSGSYLAYLLAKKGEKVNLYEEHSVVGSPIQCTGLTTSSLNGIFDIDENIVINKIRYARIFSPNNNFIEVKLTGTNYVFDRDTFDKYIVNMAINEGAKLHLNSKYNGCINNNSLKIKINNEFKETDLLVGADGPFSNVAKTNGMYNDRKFVYGIQARTKLDCEEDKIDFYLGYGCFGWVVPENNKIARIGIAAYDNSRVEFDRLIKLRKATILNYQSGMIPVYNPKVTTTKDNVYLLGDAATQVKATTYGGIIQGLIAAKEMAKSFEDYDKNWRKSIGKDLWISLYARKIMDRFTTNDYNELVRLFSQYKLKKVLEDNDRDYLAGFALQLLIKEPKLFKFLKYIVFN